MFVAWVVGAVLVALATVNAWGWVLARVGWARERVAHASSRATLQVRQAQFEAELNGRKAVQLELERVRRELELERGGVRHLVPSFSPAKSSDASAGFLRQAFRAWLLWFNDCPGVLPMRDLLSAELEPDMRHLMCCELYARAIMESATAAHLDGANPRSDREVLRQLADTFGDELATRVAVEVAARGVVFSSPVVPAAPLAAGD